MPTAMQPNDAPTTKKRIEYIDAMRGFTMILVVLSHVIIGGYHIEYPQIYEVATFNNLFVRFRMPLFFFVSGFVLYKATALKSFSEVCAFLRKKFVVQIVPTAVFYLLFCHVFGFDPLLGLLDSNKQGYWFTVMLFEYFVLYCLLWPATRRLPWGGAWLMLAACAIYLGSMLYKLHASRHGDIAWVEAMGVPNLRYFLFFIVGTLVRKHYEWMCNLMDNRWAMAAAIALFVLSFFVVSSYFDPHVWFVLSFVPEGLLGVFVVLAFFRRYEAWFTKQTRLGCYLQYIGRRTLDVYLLHYFFVPRNLHSLGQWFAEQQNPVIEFACSLALSLLVIGVVLVVSNVLRLSSLYEHYLFGVKSNK